MQSLPLHARKTPTKGGQGTDYSTAISPHCSADYDLNAEMITWATTKFTQIRWKRHFDVKLWVGTLYPRISSTPLSNVAPYRSDGHNVSPNRTELTFFVPSQL
jgi:hypothetical protein